MSRTNTFPNVAVIDTTDVNEDLVGKFVSAKVGEIMTDIGLGNIVPHSARILVASKNKFVLHFTTIAPYALTPQEVDLLRSNTRKRKELAED